MKLGQLFIALTWIVALGTDLAHAGGAMFPGPETSPVAPSLYATIEAIGVVAPYTGDDNQNNTASVRYRAVSESAWLAGPDMSVDRLAREWRVSLVYCSPGTEYEVEVRYTDPDGVAPVAVGASVRTRPDYPDVGSGGRIRYVPDDGDLQTVIAAASVGDTIRLRAGTYYTSAVLGPENSGAPGSYLTIEAAPGARVVLDGSDPDVNNALRDNWLQYKDSIYYTDLPWADASCENGSLPGYVGEQSKGDSKRYLLYKGASQWSSFLVGPAGKAYYDCNGRLYVVTYESDDPDGHEIHISRQDTGLTLAGADYVRIRNLEFRYYGAYGVYLTKPGADYNVVERNTFRGNGAGHIRIGKYGTPGSSDNLIQDNQLSQSGYRDSGWSWDVAYDHAAFIAVLLTFVGPGNVIRRNTSIGGWDAIDLRAQSHHTDIYENTVQETMDDGIEVDDEPGHNIRVWGNRIRNCYSGISNQNWFAGDYWNTGPIYIFRNVIEGGADPQGRTDLAGGVEGYCSYSAFKVGGHVDWLGRVYYYHNTVSFLDPSHDANGVQASGGKYFSGIVSRNNLWSVNGKVYEMSYAAAIRGHDMDCNNLHNAGTPTDTDFVLWSGTGGPEGNGLYRSLADFQRYTGQELHSLSNNRTLFNPDLSLRAGSPEIDAGCVLVGFNDRGPRVYRGLKPDIGAFESWPPPDISGSTKEASAIAVSSGDTLTYTVQIVNSGTPLTSTVFMTDVLPAGLDYLPGTATATVGTAWATYQLGSATVYWQGVMNDIPVVQIRYAVSVELDETAFVSNAARISSGSTPLIERSDSIIVNGWPFYLPIILRDW